MGIKRDTKVAELAYLDAVKEEQEAVYALQGTQEWQDYQEAKMNLDARKDWFLIMRQEQLEQTLSDGSN